MSDGLISAIVLLALALSLCWTSLAWADYEQVGEHFGGSERVGVSGEAERLEDATSMAINASGAGLPAGEAGSLYVVGRHGLVLRYGPGQEGEEPPFKEAWGWGVWNGAPEFQRCGPAVSGYETCAARVFEGEGEEIGHFETLSSVAVDQATGYVYVFNVIGQLRKHHLIEIFNATGTPVENGSGEDGFGDAGRKEPEPGESIAEGPAKLHFMFAGETGLAVDEAGTVYVTDYDYGTIANPPGEARVMCFEPKSPGDYAHYVYCGQSRDITSLRSQWFTKIALAPENRLVAAGRELIREYALGGGSTPLCSMVPEGTLGAMAANSLTGEVFYFVPSERAVHRLGPCDAETGKFEEMQSAEITKPKTENIIALAVNPSLSWGALRPAGILYAADGHAGTGDVFVPARVFAPGVVGESVANTTSSSTALQAEIDPRGFTTHFRFQYLNEATYAGQKAQAENEGKSTKEAEDAAFVGAVEAPLGTGQIGGGGVGIATAGITGLSFDTEYALRVIATSECEGKAPLHAPCETSGRATFFRTYPATTLGLPDNRAYELVSPAEKYGGEVFPADDFTRSCLDECKPPGAGITVVFPMQSSPNGDSVTYMGFPFSPEEGSAVTNDYLSRRTESGWQTTAMSPRLQPTRETTGNPLGTLAFDPSLQYDLIAQREPALAPGAPVGYANLYLQGAGDPESLVPLLTVKPPNRTETGFKLEYAGHSADFSRQFFVANDALSKATVFAPEPPDPTSIGRDLYESHEGRLAIVNVAPGNDSVLAGASFASQSPDTHAISENGRRVYFVVGAQLYVREDGELTREVRDPGTFLTASPDGLRVLLSDGCLYSLVSEDCTDLTEHEGSFSGIAGQSVDLSRVYFVDTKVLPGSGQNKRNEAAQSGEDNLYLWEAGAGVRFIAVLGTEAGDDWALDPGGRTAEASTDGQWLAFASKASLTGYDSFGPACASNGPGELVPAHCTEAFLYDAVTGQLHCASCNPTGEAPRGRSTLRRIADAPPGLPQPRYLTDSGRLYFDSQDRLSPLDVNGRVEDVYEFELGGVGSCVREAGCVSLISPGTGLVDSNLLAVDETGANAFFTTRERLVPRDKDELLDLYDAREGGGFPSDTETGEGECQGEACQATPAPSVFETPGSATFSGAGNLVSPLSAASGEPKPKTTVKRTGTGGRLAKELRVCRRKHAKRKRVACEKQARKRANGASGATRRTSRTTAHGMSASGKSEVNR